MGMLYKRGAVWWIKYYRNGRGMRESSHSTKERVAKRLLKIREGDIENGLPVDPKLNRIRFEEAAEDLKTEYAVNGRRSADELERRIRLHLLPHFGGRRLATIRTPDINTFILKRQADVIVSGEGDDRKERRFSNGEINRELTTLKRIFNLARQNGKLTFMPHIPMLKGTQRADGLLRARTDRACPGSSAAGRSASGTVRVHHRLADSERGPTPPVATHRLRSPCRSSGPAHDEERRRPNLSFHRRVAAASGGSEGRAR